MNSEFLQCIAHATLLVLMASPTAVAPLGQVTAPVPCPATADRAPSLVEVENLLRAEIFSAAECGARALIASQPSSPDAHYLLAYTLNRTNKPDESLSEYTAGAELRLPSSNDLAVVALDYALLKDYNDAAKWMKQALTGDGGNAQYWYYLGRIQYKLDAFNDALASFRKSLSLQPKDTRDLYNLGLSYEGLGQPEKAIDLYRQAIASEPDGTAQDAQPFYNLGSLLAQQEKTEAALPLLQRAVELAPRNPAMLERLAKVEVQTGQLAAGRQHLEAAVSLKPDASALHFELGHLYVKLHMSAEAKQQFDICGTLAGTHSNEVNESLDFSKP